jgi:hypothetical protein
MLFNFLVGKDSADSIKGEIVIFGAKIAISAPRIHSGQLHLQKILHITNTFVKR